MSMPRAVRHINEVRIVAALVRQGRSTRAALARELGLMRSTVGHLVAGLVAQGLVVEGADDAPPADATSTVARRGRPGQVLALAPMQAVFIGADIGIGHLSVVAVDLLGRVFERRSFAFTPEAGEVDAPIAALATAVRALIKTLPDAAALRGICLTVPGLVDHDGVVLRAPVLGWQQVAVRERFARKLRWDGPVALENDANAFAAAALQAQPPHARGHALYVYLDAGIGGGIVAQGELLRGHGGFAGEIGHIALGGRGFDASVPLPGSFESYAARGAVLARWRQQGGPGGHGDDLDAFLAALAAHEPAARRTAVEWAGWMGRGLASLVSVLDPGRIVLGGPVAAIHAQVEPELAAALARHLVQPGVPVVIERSDLGREACALGGALLLQRRHLAVDERLVYGAAPGA